MSSDIPDPVATAAFLMSNGYVLVKYPESMLELQEQFKATIQTFPELAEQGLEATTGAFGAINTPSSLHNPFVRKIRDKAFQCMKPIIENVAKKLNYKNIEVLIDRMCIRKAGTSVQGENIHRDEAKSTGACFGGWLSIQGDQTFTCIPGSQGNGAGGGFATIKNPERYKHQLKTIVVPQGFMIIFFEDIVHAIAKSTLKTEMLRLFLAYRISNESKPLVAESREHLVNLLTQQDLIPIKSGQKPPMYPELYWVNHRDKLTTFSKNFKAACKHRRTVKSGKNKGLTLEIVKRHLGSLKDLGAPYEPYKPEEIQILLPTPIV